MPPRYAVPSSIADESMTGEPILFYIPYEEFLEGVEQLARQLESDHCSPITW
jgi:hypothetical protein